MVPPKKKNTKQAVAVLLAEKQKDASGLFGSRAPAVPDRGTQGALTVRNQLRGQRGRAK